jgi:hypothetical protein
VRAQAGARGKKPALARPESAPRFAPSNARAARPSAVPARTQASRPRPELDDYDPELDQWSTRQSPDKPRFERRARASRDFPVDEPGQPGTRRPLSHTGGRVERLEGRKELLPIVERGLSVDPERGVRDHVHGFHSYPARLHPVTAATLIAQLSPERGVVADPFCGCGTVLVEARRLGRKSLGADLNPLAVRLTRFKTQPLSAEQRDELLAAATRVAEHAEERRRAAAGPTHRYAPLQREAFDIHVLLELDGLSDGIKQEEPGFLRQSLNLALSSIFSKVARDNKASRDGSPEAPPAKRLASGFTIRFFQSRVGELVQQLAEYEALLPEKVPPVHVREVDARELASLAWRDVDLFVSSPPYPGVLDYAEYHRTRLSWLGIDSQNFEQREIGARRHLQRLDHEQAAAAWEADFRRVLDAMRAALAPAGHIALVLADSLLAGKPYPADVVVERVARRVGLSVVARGSQRRPHFHRQSAKAFADRPRYEHLLLLQAD